MPEPLLHFNKKIPFEPNNIQQLTIGEKYVGIMLKNGNIGVCSTLQAIISDGDADFVTPDLNIISHRIIYNAYLNASVNYSTKTEDEKDIFDHIDFSKRKRIVMVGFFKPLVKKFQESGIELDIFDRIGKDNILHDYNKMKEYLANAGTVILTSTTIFNGTFSSVLKNINSNCDVFLLGPSSILHPDMLKYSGIKKIYGARFEKYDTRILDLIGDGKGTRTFLPYGIKVNI